MNEVPVWPAKLSREQQRMAKQRDRDFDATLKARARAAGWRYARGTLFRQAGDWFVDVLAGLGWERGAFARLGHKPMALDPLFWDIVGLPENRALPLSFRATGAWVLRPATSDGVVAAEERKVEPLAAAVLDWAGERSEERLAGLSVRSMFDELPAEADLRGGPRALAVCLHILDGDLDAAMRLCIVADPTARPLMREDGGFSTGLRDGSSVTFLDQARDWIAVRRRGSLMLV